MKDFVNFDNELIAYNGELILFDDYIKRLHLETNGHGTMTASPMSGYSGTGLMPAQMASFTNIQMWNSHWYGYIRGANI